MRKYGAHTIMRLILYLLAHGLAYYILVSSESSDPYKNTESQTFPFI
jgi:hypothetical protein